MARFLFYALVIGVCVWIYIGRHPELNSNGRAYGGSMQPNMLAEARVDGPPIQIDLKDGDVPSWLVGNFEITPLARYAIKARILHRESYWLDKASALSPEDFALGWQRMADPAVSGKLDIGQGSRWYTYHWEDEPPIDEEEIATESANTHILPASPALQAELSGFKAGDMIQMSGYLVEVTDNDGWTWKSSLTRTDTGDGSCEVMWVEKAAKVAR